MDLQKSLFPDGGELRDLALDALADLDVAAGLALVERQRAVQPELAALDEIEEALRWLGAGLPNGERGPTEAAELLLCLPASAAAGELSEAAARFADRALARFALNRAPARAAFVDGGRGVAAGSLWLVSDAANASAARGALERALSEAASAEPAALPRADLLGRLGDAWLLLGDDERASELHVHALAVDPRRFDLFRTARESLAELHRELAAASGDALARELLLVEAWLVGLVRATRGLAWVEDELPRLLAAAKRLEGDARRAREFSLLFLRDACGPGGDLACRARLEELDPHLLARVVRARGVTPSPPRP